MTIPEPSDPRFKDPAVFPCAVVGCDDRAAGWVLREAMELHNVGDYEVWAGRVRLDRVSVDALVASP